MGYRVFPALEVLRNLKTEYLLDRQVELVLAALMPANRLAVRVILHTGLRVDDVLSLRTADLKPEFWVTEKKTGKRKKVGLPRPLLEDLRAQAGEKYVFQHRTDPERHRTRQTVWADVKRAAVAFRLPQNVAPHSFRKVYAVDLMRRYGDIATVQRALNHDSDITTMIYAMADQTLRAHGKRRRAGRGPKA